MGSLESLSNPVSRLAVLPDAMNVNKSAVDNSPFWDVEKQYYANDVVFSSVNSGAYLMVGGQVGPGGVALLSVRGGADPSADDTGVWLKTSQSSWLGYNNPTIAVPAPGATVITVSAGATQPALPAYTYAVTFSGTMTCPLVTTAADWATWTWTPTGAGAQPLVVDILPNVGVVATNFSVSGLVTMGDAVAPPAVDLITMSGAKATAGQVQTYTNARVTYTRLD